MQAFDATAWSGTAMGNLSTPEATARLVVDGLRERHSSNRTLVEFVDSEPVCYSRDLAFVTVKSPQGEYGLTIDPWGRGGTKRTNPPPKPEHEPFPLAITAATPAKHAAKTSAVVPDALVIAGTLAEHLKSSLPALIQKSGWPRGDFTITSVPDLVFVARVHERLWRVSYNSLTGTVSGQPLETPLEPLSWRKFLLRLHLAHGYPLSSSDSRWVWAIVVDVMAFVMVYWGASGLLMWWQIKATRRLGLVIVGLSLVAAGVLVIGMHGVIRGG